MSILRPPNMGKLDPEIRLALEHICGQIDKALVELRNEFIRTGRNSKAITNSMDYNEMYPRKDEGYSPGVNTNTRTRLRFRRYRY